VNFASHKIPWANPALWGFMAFYGMGTTPLAFIIYDSPLYLSSRFHWDQAMLGAVLWIPPLGSALGFFFWGWFQDRFGSDNSPHLMLAPIVLAIPFACTHWLPVGSLVLASMFLMMFAVSGVTVLALAEGTAKFPAQAALLGGLGSGSFGLISAVAMPEFGRLFDHSYYGPSFQLVAALPVVGYAAWRLLRRKRSPTV
jgi:MFS family permease